MDETQSGCADSAHVNVVANNDDSRDGVCCGQNDAVVKAYELLGTDPDLGFSRLQQLVEANCSWAMLYLGWAYQTGLGTKIDSNQAKAWYRRAYECGIDESGRFLGYYAYCDGHIEQKRKNYKEAFQCFSTGENYRYAPAIYRLGVLYEHGLGVKKQPARAISLFEDAAKMDNLAAERKIALKHIFGYYGLTKVFYGMRLFIRYMREVITVIGEDESSERLRR